MIAGKTLFKWWSLHKQYRRQSKLHVGTQSPFRVYSLLTSY